MNVTLKYAMLTSGMASAGTSVALKWYEFASLYHELAAMVFGGLTCAAFIYSIVKNQRRLDRQEQREINKFNNKKN